jgi:hypothetical protein
VPTLSGTLEIIVSPVFHEEGFDSGEETSLRIPETTQHSKECSVRGGVPHRRAPQSQCGGLEGGPIVVMTASAACFFPACYPSPAGNGDDEE